MKEEKTTVIRWHQRLASNPEVVFIGRPSRWGNPFRTGVDGSRQEVIDLYILWFIQPQQAALRAAAARELRGKKLACYCAPLPCHGHVLAYYIDNGGENLYTRARWASGA
jgi:hypothetical protein